jgi:hypothetical protein
MSAKLYTSLAEAMQELKQRGFTANFPGRLPRLRGGCKRR